MFDRALHQVMQMADLESLISSQASRGSIKATMECGYRLPMISWRMKGVTWPKSCVFSAKITQFNGAILIIRRVRQVQHRKFL